MQGDRGDQPAPVTSRFTSLCPRTRSSRPLLRSSTLAAALATPESLANSSFLEEGEELGALLATLPNRSELEISPFVLTREYMGIGVPKGETKLTATIDQILQGLEKDGTAGRIYDRWFGPKSAAPLPRDFIIGSTK